MRDSATHRFVWGYGESGYAQLAQNAELPDALSAQARAVIDRCHFSENRPGLLLVPIERSAYLLVARVRLISPEGDQRPYWERAVALVPLERLSEAAPSFAALLSLLPDFGARGVLSPDEVAVQKSEPHEPPLKTPTTESALQRLWCAVHLGLQTVLTHGTEDAELALCANLWNKLWPDKYKTLMIALGLELPPRRGELTCIYSGAPEAHGRTH